MLRPHHASFRGWSPRRVPTATHPVHCLQPDASPRRCPYLDASRDRCRTCPRTRTHPLPLRAVPAPHTSQGDTPHALNPLRVSLHPGTQPGTLRSAAEARFAHTTVQIPMWRTITGGYHVCPLKWQEYCLNVVTVPFNNCACHSIWPERMMWINTTSTHRSPGLEIARVISTPYHSQLVW